jgi:hypothetical protein
MAVIDTLTAKVRNALKKTGDAMIAGDLTLFQAPTADMHAVTKKYVDDQLAGVDVLQVYAPRRVGSYYANTFGKHHLNSQWGANNPGVMNGGKMAPLYVGRAASWNELRQRVINNGDTFGVYRWGVYELDPTTLLPVALLLDAGSIQYNVGAPVDRTIAISLSTTCDWIGLGVVCEGTNAGVARPTFLAQSVSLTATNYTGFYPFGVTTIPATNATMPPFLNYAMDSTTEPRGVMPPASAWTLTGDISGSAAANTDGGLWIRLASFN